MEIPKKVHESWHPHFIKHKLFLLPEIEQIKKLVLGSAPNIYPPVTDIFNVFQMPLDQIRVVILGQDPYYYKGAANGYSFAVNKTTNMPMSLRTILNEINNEATEKPYLKTLQLDLDEWKTLKHWRQQGVFLLNTALTVRDNSPGSHTRYWKKFIDGVIKIIAKEVTPVWFLWGAHAKSYKSTIRNSETFLVNEIFEASHPATEATGRVGGFYGCNHFKEANILFSNMEQKQIIW